VQATTNERPHISVKGIQAFLDTLQYPLYYLDFESITPAIPRYDNSRPYQQLCFQFSLHIEQEDGSIEHKEFLAEANGDPRPAFIEALKEALGDSGSIIVYSKTFENSRLREIARDYPEHEEWVDKTIARVVDLYDPFKDFHYYHPNQKGSASIKKVLPALTDLSYADLEINNGGLASKSFESLYDAPSEEIRQQLLEYCKLDTLAEVEIVKKLRELIR